MTTMATTLQLAPQQMQAVQMQPMYAMAQSGFQPGLQPAGYQVQGGMQVPVAQPFQQQGMIQVQQPQGAAILRPGGPTTYLQPAGYAMQAQQPQQFVAGFQPQFPQQMGQPQMMMPAQMYAQAQWASQQQPQQVMMGSAPQYTLVANPMQAGGMQQQQQQAPAGYMAMGPGMQAMQPANGQGVMYLQPAPSQGGSQPQCMPMQVMAAPQAPAAPVLNLAAGAPGMMPYNGQGMQVRDLTRVLQPLTRPYTHTARTSRPATD